MTTKINIMWMLYIVLPLILCVVVACGVSIYWILSKYKKEWIRKVEKFLARDI